MIIVPNRRPWLETAVLAAVFLCAGIAAFLWGFAILNLPAALYAILSVITTLIWLIVGIWLIKKALKKDGTLQIEPSEQKVTINNKTYNFHEVNFYKSALIAPRLGFVSVLSSQHITFGVDGNRFTVADDVAAKLFNTQHYEILPDFINQTGLTDEQKLSFNNWLGRAQTLS